MTTTHMEGAWREATASFSKDVANKWWSNLVEKYTDRGGGNRNLQDVESKFRHFETVKEVLKNPNAVALALFFHHYEYDLKDGDFNAKNMEHFKTFANEAGIQTESELYTQVLDLMEAASTHSTDEHKMTGAYGSEDHHYFLDIDIIELGSSPEDYERFAAKIRQEYDFMTEDMYRTFRRKVFRMNSGHLAGQGPSRLPPPYTQG
ncbi:uncharacterized protein [Anabrus simplex]|uniref:uncharacterized protein isoform X2 n=1 Tax=Anabrus simplex TaxID=316456 RepID=UPI0035A33E77